MISEGTYIQATVTGFFQLAEIARIETLVLPQLRRPPDASAASSRRVAAPRTSSLPSSSKNFSRLASGFTTRWR